MKRQIRRGVFETNSSSTHSLTMCTKAEYDKWRNGEVLLYKGGGWRFPNNNEPKKNSFYTKEEVINFLKNSKYPPDNDFDWDDEESVEDYLREEEFYSFDNFGYDYEWFDCAYTTESGEEIVAFGYYGYSG